MRVCTKMPGILIGDAPQSASLHRWPGNNTFQYHPASPAKTRIPEPVYELLHTLKFLSPIIRNFDENSMIWNQSE